MSEKLSKPIQKTDDSAKQLIIEALDGRQTGGFDLDSVYLIKDTYYVLEFLKCDTVRPFQSHPRRYWFKNKQKFLSLWAITCKLNGRLYLVNYEDSREQFKVIRVLEMDESGIKKEEVKRWNFSEFKSWFQALNNLEIRKEKSTTNQDNLDVNKLVSINISAREKFTSFLPIYSIKAACGYFGNGESVDELGWIKVEGLGRLNSNMFVVQAVGRSMEPKIHDGEYCVFQANPAGTRQGKIVLAQHRGYFDEENAGAFSIKKYESQKSFDEFGNWQHEEIKLIPLNSDYEPITITSEDAEDFRVVAEFVATL